MSECDTCINLQYDDELEEWECFAQMDEDEVSKLYLDKRSRCPMWKSNDEYRIVRHQSIGHLPGYQEDRF